MAQLTGEVAYLHQACALCFAMRDNLAAAVVSTLPCDCEPMLHTRERGSRLSPESLLGVVQRLLPSWTFSPQALSNTSATATWVPHPPSVLLLGRRMCSQRQSALYYKCD